MFSYLYPNRLWYLRIVLLLSFLFFTCQSQVHTNFKKKAGCLRVGQNAEQVTEIMEGEPKRVYTEDSKVVAEFISTDYKVYSLTVRRVQVRFADGFVEKIKPIVADEYPDIWNSGVDSMPQCINKNWFNLPLYRSEWYSLEIVGLDGKDTWWRKQERPNLYTPLNVFGKGRTPWCVGSHDPDRNDVTFRLSHPKLIDRIKVFRRENKYSRS